MYGGVALFQRPINRTAAQTLGAVPPVHLHACKHADPPLDCLGFRHDMWRFSESGTIDLVTGMHDLWNFATTGKLGVTRLGMPQQAHPPGVHPTTTADPSHDIDRICKLRLELTTSSWLYLRYSPCGASRANDTSVYESEKQGYSSCDQHECAETAPGERVLPSGSIHAYGGKTCSKLVPSAAPTGRTSGAHLRQLPEVPSCQVLWGFWNFEAGSPA